MLLKEERLQLNKSMALTMNEHIESMIHHANHVLYVANNSGDEKLKLRTQKVLGMVVAELHLELQIPLYKEYPEMRPVDR